MTFDSTHHFLEALKKNPCSWGDLLFLYPLGFSFMELHSFRSFQDFSDIPAFSPPPSKDILEHLLAHESLISLEVPPRFAHVINPSMTVDSEQVFLEPQH